MSKEVTAYKCEVCGTLYLDKESADACEKLPNYDNIDSELGSIIQFNAELVNQGVVETKQESGIVRKKVFKLTGDNVHIACLVVEDPRGFERLILKGYDDKLYAPLNTIRPKGFY